MNSTGQSMADDYIGNDNVRSLFRLVKKTSVDTTILVSEGLTGIAKHLVQSLPSKLFVVNVWPVAMPVASLGNHQIMWSAGRFRNRKCHVGKELLPMWECFQAILPPENGRFGEVNQWIEAAGIQSRWIKEVLGMGQALRVQDRVKFRGPTKIKDDPREAVALNLQGKMARAFALWGICLGICIMSLCMELAYLNISRIVTKCFCLLIWQKAVSGEIYVGLL